MGLFCSELLPPASAQLPVLGNRLWLLQSKHSASVPRQEFGEGVLKPFSRSLAYACDPVGVSGSWVSCCSELCPRTCASGTSMQ